MSKKWKTLTGILLLIVASGCQVTLDPSNPEDKALRDLKNRIKQFEVLKTEHQLTLDIMRLKVLIAQMKDPAPSPAFQRPPMGTSSRKVEIPELGIEGEFIPLDELPPDMQ